MEAPIDTCLAFNHLPSFSGAMFFVHRRIFFSMGTDLL
jgi:hypothetical protein